MSRATVARVRCDICGYNEPGVVMAAVPGEDGDHPRLFQGCLNCLDEMFDVAKLLQMRIRASEGGIRRVDYGPDWTKTRDLIVQRDDGQCQDGDHQAIAGAQLGDSLVVHHIKPLKEFGGDYLAANDPENLITLCGSCHGRWHGALTRAKNQEQR